MPPDLRAVSALIFDFDGTLAVPTLDFSLLRQRAEACLAPHIGAAAPESAKLPVMERLAAICAALPPDKAARLRRECLSAIEDVEVEAARRSALFPFTRPMLSSLRNAGFGLAVVTRNCPAAVLTVFPDLRDFCPFLFTRNDVSRVKPHPEHMGAALKSLGRKGGEVLTVGDHPMDIEAGRRIGALTAAVASGESGRDALAPHHPDILADNAGEAVRLLGITF